MSKDTNAGGVVAGFVYQIYYFLYRLLTMQKGEIVSLEKFEDVGSEGDGSRTYYQLKHTIATTNTKVERMRDRDKDLWKTLSMWIDKIEVQGNEDKQRKWIVESEFVLLSNKTTEENTFFQKVETYKNEDKWDELKQYIGEQAAKGVRCKDVDEKKKSILKYTKHVNDFCLLKEFLLKVRPEFKSDNDILDDIDYWLVNKHHFKTSNAKVLRATLYGRLSEMLKEKKIEFNLETFHNTFGELFTKVKERKFVPKNRKVRIPEEPRKQTFIRQLVDINDVLVQDIDDVKELTMQKLQFENDYNDALSVSDDDDRVVFEKDVKARWKRYHRKHNNGINLLSTEEDVILAAQQVLEEVRGEHMIFDQDPLNESSSNGCFYHFSDGKNPKIGWRYDWKEKYDGEEWTIE